MEKNKRFTEAVRKAGITRLQLIATAHLSSTTVNLVERCGHIPNMDTQQKIAAALGVQPTDIWPTGGK